MNKIQFFDDSGKQATPETWAKSVYMDDAKQTLQQYVQKIDTKIASISSSYIVETEEAGLYICDNLGRYIFKCDADIDAISFGEVLKNEIDKIIIEKTASLNQKVNAINAVVFEERESGSIKIYGQQKPLYQLNAELFPLPTSVGVISKFKISDKALGDNTYLNINRFSVTDGVGGIITTSLTSNYNINKIYTDTDLCTYVDIECVKTVDIQAKCILGLEYVKEVGETLHLQLTFPEGTDMSNVLLIKPLLKYNKKATFLYTTDDAFASAYNNFAYCTGRPYNNAGLYTHYGMNNLPNANNSKRYYTDGCGTIIPFRFEVAMWPWNDLSDAAPWAQDPQLSYSEVEYFCDFGNMICCHDVFYNHNDPTAFDIEHNGSWSTNDIPISVDGTKEDIAKGMYWTPRWLHAKTGIMPKTCIEPSGNSIYGEAFKIQDTIKCHIQKKSGSMNYLNYDRANAFLYKVDADIINRDFAYSGDVLNDATKVIPYLQAMAASTNHDDYVIACTGVHNDRNGYFAMCDALCESVGGKGTDVLWFTTATEMYEYFYLRNRSEIKMTVNGNEVELICHMPPTEHFYYKDFSLVLQGVSVKPTVEIVSNNIYCERNAVTTDGLLININYNKLSVDRAEKYVSKYEAGRKAQDRFDAVALLPFLSDVLQTAFMARITAIDATLG